MWGTGQVKNLLFCLYKGNTSIVRRGADGLETSGDRWTMDDPGDDLWDRRPGEIKYKEI